MNNSEFGEKAPIIAAIDVGTNSFHMVIALVDIKGTMKVITREKEMVRLGAGAKDMKLIAPDAMQRGIVTMQRFAKLAETHGAKIRAIATSAVREAQNKLEFIQKVKKTSGVDIEVVSGNEEGRLIYLGTVHALPIFSKKTLVIDIGGGSTETIIGKEGETIFVYSEKIGTIRLKERFFPNGYATKESIRACRDYLNGTWSPVLDRIKKIGFDAAVGTSGTIQAIAAITQADAGISNTGVLNGITISGDAALHAISKICKANSIEEIMGIKSMDEKRADIIVAGAMIIEYAIKYLGIKKLHVSPYALREGVLFDTLSKMRNINQFNHLTNLRRQTIYILCKRFEIEMTHAEHVKFISLKLFDQLSRVHSLNNKERELLEASALLHDAGYSISHDKHHKHSYYIITNTDMPGFTNGESELIANIARYHRKSHPKPKHDNFTRLSSRKQYVVKVLAGILRVAEGIDRRQKQIIDDIKVTNINARIDICLHARGNATTPDVELWGADRRKTLLEEIFRKKISFSTCNNLPQS